MTIIEKLNDDIKAAMRSKDQLRLDTLRMLKSKIIAVDARATLPDADVLKLFKTYSGNLQEALEQSLSLNIQESAEKLKKEIEIVQEFLPVAPSAEETKKIVEQAIADTGAKTKKEFGFVMKKIMEINSTVDGKLAKEFANQLLTE